MHTRDPKALVRRMSVLLLTLLMAFGPAAAFAAPAPPADSAPYAEGRFLVKFAPGARADEVRSLNARHGVSEIGKVERLGVRVMSVPRGKSAEALARAYAANPNVDFAEPDYLVQASLTPNDTHYSVQWAMPKISAPAAWDVTTGSTAVTIAIVDTGIDASHPDLAGRVIGGYDYVNTDTDPSDDNGHGTMCAGVAAANGNNARGVAGMDWAAKLLAVKVLDSTGNGYTSTVASGIVYAADNGADVISLSLGSAYGGSTLSSAVDYAFGTGSLLVAASGNDAAGSVSYPAAYANVMAIGATDKSDLLASFSNYGAAQDVVAPGVDIATTGLNGAYYYFSGTSAATPFVAGLAGLALAKDPTVSNIAIAEAIRAGVTDLGAPGWDSVYGWGRIDAKRTLDAIVVAPNPDPDPEPVGDTVAPTVAITSPSSGAAVSRTITVKASASDDVGVARVEFFVDGVSVAVDTAAAWEFRWDTTKVANGSHVLTAVAYDAAGNSATSAAVTVNVSNRTTSTPGKKK